MATVTRGKILRGDLANWDGKTATATRPDATGGTITGLVVGNEVEVLQVFGGGTSRTRGTIASAVQYIGSSRATLSFAPGTWLIDSNITIPSNLSIRVPEGCLFSINSGVTMTINGAIDADEYQIFTGDGSLSIRLGAKIGWFGPEFDGSTDDAAAQNKAFGAGLTKYTYPRGKIIKFDSQLVIPAGYYIDFNGCTLRKTTSDATTDFQIEVGNGSIIEDYTLEIPSGVTILRGIRITTGARSYNGKITATTQQNNVGNSDHIAFRVDGDDAIIDHLEVENFDRAIRIKDSDDGKFSNLKVSSYSTGLTMPQCARFSVENYTCHTTSPNASSNSGQDGLVVEDGVDGQFSNLRLDDASEHGAYISASASHLAFSNVDISSPGKTGFKCSGGPVSGRMQHVQVNGLHVIDCSTGSTPGTNEEGLLLEYCDYLTVTGYSLSEIASKAFRGVYILDSTNLKVSGVVRNTSSHGVVVTDKNVTSGVASAATLTNIDLSNLDILSAGGHGLFVDIGDASTTVSGLKARNLFVGSPNNDGVRLNLVGGNVTGAILIEGHVRNPGGAVYNNVNGVGDEEINVRLRTSEAREIVTGTVTLDVHCPHSVLNSAAGAVTATLPDGVEVHQEKLITMSNDSNVSTVSVDSHTTSSPEVFTFNSTNDRLSLKWDGTTWYTLSNTGVAT